MKSAKPAEDALTPDVPAFYAWKVPGTAVHIRMRLDVVRRIREYLTGSVRQESEVGGLLIGNPHARWTEITDFAPISRNSEAGPHFVLSDAEIVNLRGYIGEVNRTSSENSVIGYFRSDVREGVRLYDEDQKLVQDVFSDPSNVFLVVHTGQDGLATAGFFFSDNGAIFSSFSFMEFEFDEALLAAQMRSRSEVASESLDVNGSEGTAAISGESTPSRGLFAISGSHGAKNSARWLAVPAGISIALVIVAGYFYNNRAKDPTPATSEVNRTRASTSASMGLSVTGSGSVIDISWDSKSPLVAAARVGLLTIDDGGQRRDLPLTKVQLLSSKLVYTRTTDTVHIALETYGEDGTVSRENVIAMANTASTAPTTQYETRVNTSLAAPPEVGEKKRTPVRDFVAPPGQHVAAQQQQSPTLPVEAPAPLTARLDLRQMPPTQQEPLGVPGALPASPSASVSPPPRADAPPGFAGRPTQPIQIVSQTQQRPPVPVRQVRPVLPDNVKAMLTSRASAKVRVQVDATGRVTGADPIVTGGSLERILGTAAASAAKMWIFQPATEGDRRVPSELTVEFTFVPETKKR